MGKVGGLNAAENGVAVSHLAFSVVDFLQSCINNLHLSTCNSSHSSSGCRNLSRSTCTWGNPYSSCSARRNVRSCSCCFSICRTCGAVVGNASKRCNVFTLVASTLKPSDEVKPLHKHQIPHLVRPITDRFELFIELLRIGDIFRYGYVFLLPCEEDGSQFNR